MESIFIVLLVATASFFLYRGWKKHCEKKAKCLPGRPEEEKRFGEGERDLVDEAAWESFPASDPPAHSRVLEPCDNCESDKKKEP